MLIKMSRLVINTERIDYFYYQPAKVLDEAVCKVAFNGGDPLKIEGDDAEYVWSVLVEKLGLHDDDKTLENLGRQ